MSCHQQEQCRRGWTSMEDIERSLLSASKITRNSDGAQRGLPVLWESPISEPQEKQNELTADPVMISDCSRNKPFTTRGRGALGRGMAHNAGFRCQRTSRGMSKGFPVPGTRGYWSSEEVHPVERSARPPIRAFKGLKVTSIPPPSTLREAVEIPHTLSTNEQSARVGLDHSGKPKNVVSRNDTQVTSSSHPDVVVSHSNSVQPQISYSDPFSYSIDESHYVKCDYTQTSLLPGEQHPFLFLARRHT